VLLAAAAAREVVIRAAFRPNVEQRRAAPDAVEESTVARLR